MTSEKEKIKEIVAKLKKERYANADMFLLSESDLEDRFVEVAKAIFDGIIEARAGSKTIVDFDIKLSELKKKWCD